MTRTVANSGICTHCVTPTLPESGRQEQLRTSHENWPDIPICGKPCVTATPAGMKKDKSSIG